MEASRKLPERESMPERLGRYDIRAKIAEGGMATVYVGQVRGEENRLVAIKAIKMAYSANPEFLNMFLDEAKIIEKLAHPNIVRLRELGAQDGRLFLAMDLLLGQSLWSVWEACRDRDVRLRYDLIAWIGARVADGLEHAHSLRDASGELLGVVHRDVNASNIFITFEGEVVVIDFGLAKARNRISQTAAGIVKGKLAYMSPEQTTGDLVDARTDLFALGITLWELATDRRLFKRDGDTATLRAVYAAEVPDPRTFLEGFPDGLWNVLRKSLARDPADRYASAGEMRDALRDLSAGVGRALLSEVMQSLFALEQERQRAWLEDASTASASALRTLRPPDYGLTLPPRVVVADRVVGDPVAGDRGEVAFPKAPRVPNFSEEKSDLFLSSPRVPVEPPARASSDGLSQAERVIREEPTQARASVTPPVPFALRNRPSGRPSAPPPGEAPRRSVPPRDATKRDASKVGVLVALLLVAVVGAVVGILSAR